MTKMKTELLAEQVCEFISHDTIKCTVLKDVTFSGYFPWRILLLLPLSAVMVWAITNSATIDFGQLWVYLFVYAHRVRIYFCTSKIPWLICFPVSAVMVWAIDNSSPFWTFILILAYVVWAISNSSYFAWRICFPVTAYVVCGHICIFFSSSYPAWVLCLPLSACVVWAIDNFAFSRVFGFILTRLVDRFHIVEGCLSIGSCSVCVLTGAFKFHDIVYKTRDYHVTVQSGRLQFKLYNHPSSQSIPRTSVWNGLGGLQVENRRYGQQLTRKNFFSVRSEANEAIEGISLWQAIDPSLIDRRLKFELKGFELEVNNRCPIFGGSSQLSWLKSIVSPDKLEKLTPLLNAQKGCLRIGSISLDISTGKIILSDVEYKTDDYTVAVSHVEPACKWDNASQGNITFSGLKYKTYDYTVAMSSGEFAFKLEDASRASVSLDYFLQRDSSLKRIKLLDGIAIKLVFRGFEYKTGDYTVAVQVGNLASNWEDASKGSVSFDYSTGNIRFSGLKYETDDYTVAMSSGELAFKLEDALRASVSLDYFLQLDSSLKRIKLLDDIALKLVFRGFQYETSDYTVLIGGKLTSKWEDASEDCLSLFEEGLTVKLNQFELRANNCCPEFNDLADMCKLIPKSIPTHGRAGKGQASSWNSFIDLIPAMEVDITAGCVTLKSRQSSATMSINFRGAQSVHLRRPTIGSRRFDHYFECNFEHIEILYDFSYLMLWSSPRTTVKVSQADLNVRCPVLAGANVAQALEKLELTSHELANITPDVCWVINWALDPLVNQFYAEEVLPMLREAIKCMLGATAVSSEMAVYHPLAVSRMGGKNNHDLPLEIVERIASQILDFSGVRKVSRTLCSPTSEDVSESAMYLFIYLFIFHLFMSRSL